MQLNCLKLHIMWNKVDKEKLISASQNTRNRDYPMNLNCI